MNDAERGSKLVLRAEASLAAAPVREPDWDALAERIESALTALATAREGDDHLRIRECYDELSQATEPFARRIMDVALREAVEGRSLEEL